MTTVTQHTMDQMLDRACLSVTENLQILSSFGLHSLPVCAVYVVRTVRGYVLSTHSEADSGPYAVANPVSASQEE